MFWRDQFLSSRNSQSLFPHNPHHFLHVCSLPQATYICRKVSRSDEFIFLMKEMQPFLVIFRVIWTRDCFQMSRLIKKIRYETMITTWIGSRLLCQKLKSPTKLKFPKKLVGVTQSLYQKMFIDVYCKIGASLPSNGDELNVPRKVPPVIFRSRQSGSLSKTIGIAFHFRSWHRYQVDACHIV